ncbi:hypothetical protein PAXINDRAFT_16410 [Paxillus involutus ATCC 200175]|uniref:Uncharacterized protein n=1 Tax=Paxillus involutus ATCC 200175 TaxID=664439 RepID=A0A0C9TTP4_PAXIN|nr:hypothetical protein PAXINDRAFT_16410 [Paxillus involutus ATCC 200175]
MPLSGRPNFGRWQLSDSPGTPHRTAPDFLDLSPLIPGAFHHSTPLYNPLNTPLLLPGSPLSPLTPSSSSTSSPDLVTQFNPLPAPNPNHTRVYSPAPPLATTCTPPAMSTNTPHPSQTPENVLRALNTPILFQGKIIAELPRFLEDVGILADQAQLDHTGKIRTAICYAALDKAKLWETLELATAIPADWANFVTTVKQLYPGCEGADRYYHSDLHNLMQEYCVKPMKNREELGEYHRKFQKVAAHLISTDKLSVNERDLLFLDGLPHTLTVPVRARLQYKMPDVHPSDPYPMASTLEAMNFSPSVFWAERMTLHKATGLSPYFMAHGVEPLFPFDLAQATFLVPLPKSDSLNTTALITFCARQLQKRCEDIDSIRKKVLKSHFQSIKQFEQTFKNHIKDYNFMPRSLVLMRNTRVEKELNRKTKPCYLGPMLVI